MLDAIDEEKDVVVDGKVVTMISLDLDHDGLVWILDKKQAIHTFFNVIFHASNYVFFIFTALSSSVFCMDALSNNWTILYRMVDLITHVLAYFLQEFSCGMVYLLHCVYSLNSLI
jgi:hypothetical protein